MKSRIIIAGILVAGGMLFVACGGTGNTSQPASQTVATEPADKPPADPTAATEPTADAPPDNPAAGAEPADKTPTNHKMGDTVSIGYTSYRVHKVWWSNKLSENQFLNHAPDAAYLFVQLTVRNDDTKARSIPPFKLYDDGKREYEASSRGWAVDGSIGVLDSLNPSVAKTGFVIFDVPREHAYHLRVSGGYWSGADALIELVDDDALESRQRAEKTAADRAARELREAAKAEQREREEDAKWRTWVDATGKHKVEAKFVTKIGDVVTLGKRDGKQVKMPMAKLSDDDQQFITNRGWTAAGK